MSLLEGIIILLVALVTGASAAWSLRPRAPDRPLADDAPQDPVMFLFDGGMLHHATQTALRTFAFLPGTHVWDDLRRELLPRFPAFPDVPDSRMTGNTTIEAAETKDPAEIEVSWREGLCWVEIRERGGKQADCVPLSGDVAALRACADVMPDPVWEIRDTGERGWCNKAFADLSNRLADTGLDPLRELSQTDRTVRLEVTSETADPVWYEVTSHPFGSGTLCYAKSVTEVVEAEASQKRFVQTLSNTFAHLSIGLAIFDRKGQLAIFNPALTDLTGLTPSFLASRPAVVSFFDQLRENRRMPEPKDYTSWRQDIARMVDAAADGMFKDTWTLEDGRTYGIEGRPHADGATAFMFEDISSEVTLTRNYRIEVEQYAQLLDTVEDALVVFSASGILTFCNTAYRSMWQHNPETAFADVTIRDAVDVWGKTCKADVDWEDLIKWVKSIGPRSDRTFSLEPRRGGPLVCSLSLVVPDATLVRFSPLRTHQELTGMQEAANR